VNKYLDGPAIGPRARMGVGDFVSEDRSVTAGDAMIDAIAESVAA
jgi:hypothetical protein